MGFVKEKCEKSADLRFLTFNCKEYHTDNKQYREAKTVFIPADSKAPHNYK